MSEPTLAELERENVARKARRDAATPSPWYIAAARDDHAPERIDALLAYVRELRAALEEYIGWGAMTGSDRDYFAEKFRAMLARYPEEPDHA